MNLHEYQAKALLSRYGLPVQTGILVDTAKAAAAAFDQLGGVGAVIKAQVHAGGRGKAGGVKVVTRREDAETIAAALLGSRLITHQTDTHGQPVDHLLLAEDLYPVANELYLGAVIDRSRAQIAFIASQEGGVDIEDVAQRNPEAIFKIYIDPRYGLQGFHARALAFSLKLSGNTFKQFETLLTAAYRAFVENDMALFEINPLAVLPNGSLVCVDAKIVLDNNALYRHPDLAAQRDTAQENETEVTASQLGLSYVALDGSIGCMVNGAGLAMATMDTIALYAGRPANFLDIGGDATQDRVSAALKLIIADPSVKGILINIFGGIVRCDMVALSIIAALNEIKVGVPVVVRLEGNHAAEALQLLSESQLAVIPAHGLEQAAKTIVDLTKPKE